MLDVLLETFAIVLLAEMGDKSQLLMIAMRADYRMQDIFLGTALSAAILCGLAVMLGGVIGDLFPMTAISLIAGLAFLLFAAFGDDEEKFSKDREKKTTRYAVLSVFGTYFLAELGDKTQLSALTLSAAADGGDARAVLSVFIGATCGLLAADLIALTVGAVLEKRMPRGGFSLLSSTLFLACGATRLLDGFGRLFEGSGHATGGAIAATVLTVSVFATVLLLRSLRKRRVRGAYRIINV